jgi:hypothetical protein
MRQLPPPPRAIDDGARSGSAAESKTSHVKRRCESREEQAKMQDLSHLGSWVERVDEVVRALSLRMSMF